MANALQLRRGTTTQHNSFTGLAGEVTVDTDKETVVVHDGSTAGGFPLALESDITAASLLTSIKTVDGAASGLDADTLDGKQLATIESEYQAFANTAAANVVDSAPATLDTLNELAAALGDDPNFATTVTNSIGTKLNASSYTAADVLTKIKTVDGSGSGLDADLWDGNEFSSYLNQAVTSGSSVTFNRVNVNDYIRHSGDEDTYLYFGDNEVVLAANNSNEVYITDTGVRLGDSGNGYFRPVSGNYGSIEIGGGAHAGWEGYSIGGRIVFMHDNTSDYGLYNDVSDQWGFRSTNGVANLFHLGNAKLSTTSSGVDITGNVVADGVTVDGTLDIEEVFEKVGTFTGTSGTISLDVTSQGIYYGTSDQTANRTMNFTNVNSSLAVGQSVTASILLTQGSTAYYLNAYQVDGTAVTPKWSGGSAPTEGNASGIDVYTFTIIKTANATFTVLASQTQYA